jgi:hypothetical protein
MEWNSINKSKSWVNYFASSLSNPKPIISFEKNNNLLDKMSFCHLTQYCRSNTAVEIARILKLSTIPAGIKYKFGIQRFDIAYTDSAISRFNMLPREGRLKEVKGNLAFPISRHFQRG